MAHVAFDYGAMPFLAHRQTIETVADPVRFDVRLGAHVQAVAVAQFVETRIERIMTHAHAVDVGLANHLHVALHLGVRLRISVRGIHLVAVYAHEFYRLAVEKNESVLDRARAHSQFRAAHIAAGAQFQGVKIRILCRPQARRTKHRFALAAGHGDVGDFVPGIVEKRRGGRSVRIHRQRKPPAVFGLRHGHGGEIADSVLRLGGDEHAAENSGIADHVLVFKIGAVRPLAHAHRQQFAGGVAGHERSHVKFRRQARIFRIADPLAVEPHLAGRRNALEAQNDPPPAPRHRHRESPAVAHGRIVRGIDLGRRLAVRILYVHVMRHSPAARLHAARNVDLEPAVGRKVLTPKAVRRLGGSAVPPEIPFSVEAFHIPINRQPAARRHAVFFIALGIFPKRRIGPQNGNLQGYKGQNGSLHVEYHHVRNVPPS